MTQVQTMTNPELNRALAELMGYTTVKDKYDVITLYKNGEKLRGWWTHTEENAWAYAPDYCTDPTASLEVQTAAIKLNAVVYVANLQLIKFHRSNGLSSREDVAVLMDSSPRERAEAAYITLSQVRE
ncbi:hypothetical protein D3C81_173670 [compost metagenome]